MGVANRGELELQEHTWMHACVLPSNGGTASSTSGESSSNEASMICTMHNEATSPLNISIYGTVNAKRDLEHIIKN